MSRQINILEQTFILLPNPHLSNLFQEKQKREGTRDMHTLPAPSSKGSNVRGILKCSACSAL